ncbi:MAG TPA: Ku protein [Steroidobacteraceae bacterium]|nr:Ku protein [Steroidobacteraceae bacterium]
MARALWRGAISFGLVYVPVELHTASRENTLPLHMLDSRDFAPVGYTRINKKTGQEVDWQHIVKGYEYRKGEFVALTDADFRHANVKASETIAIDTFCEADQLPSVYFDKPYYLAPAKGGGKVYSLLRQALESTDRVAIATFVMHQRQHLCAIMPEGNALVLQTLRFADELLPVSEAGAAAVKVTSAELSMAKQIIQNMTGKFEPDRFKDTYRNDLKRRVQEKIRKKETHSLEVEAAEPEKRPKAQVIDLMAALKASVDNSKGAGRRRAASKTERGTRRRAG